MTPDSIDFRVIRNWLDHCYTHYTADTAISATATLTLVYYLATTSTKMHGLDASPDCIRVTPNGISLEKLKWLVLIVIQYLTECDSKNKTAPKIYQLSMKVSLVLYVLACAFSAMASSIRQLPSPRGHPHIAKYGYNKYYDEETNEESYQGKAMTCVPRDKLEALLNQYISTFSGIEDGGRMAKKTFDEDLKIYSQTRWWITTAVGGDLEKNIENLMPSPRTYPNTSSQTDNFPPIFENRAQFIKALIRKNNPNQWKKGLVTYGCNTFTFYWKGDFSIPEYPTVGRTFGIHIVFVNPKTSRVNKVYAEYNSLNHMYNLGAHITWAKDPVCCDCPPFVTSCKCPI
ncbi:hypothetical protein QL093DRAFT_2575500 [Fusarium oxysporum]|nr:hypothetical protein QL093DRAFT_2575500 [Fusarium oxysporum]